MNTAEHILRGLNDQQKVAVQNYTGPSFIVAGPGSGKTFTIIARTKYMICEGINPEHILLFTFTNKAAREIKERIAKAVGSDVASRITVGTYHSFCLRLLKRYGEKLGYKKNFTILDADDSEKILKRLVKNSNVDAKLVKSYISKQKRDMVSPNDASYNINDKFATFYDAYQKELFNQNAMDFDDLIYNSIRLLKANIDVRLEINSIFRYITAK